MHSLLDRPGPIAFPHRGGAGEAPENTLPAFEIAVTLGHSYPATDAHVTRDGVLVAFHDARLDRVTDRTDAIAELGIGEVNRRMLVTRSRPMAGAASHSVVAASASPGSRRSS